MRPGELVGRIIGASAGLIAVAALGTAVYTAWITREQQKMSVWPYLMQDNSRVGGQYHRYVTNAGLGPALVQSFQVRVDGKLARTWPEVIERLGLPPLRSQVHSDLGYGWVILPGQTVEVLTVQDSAEGRLVFQQRQRLRTIVCYCSLYNECWRYDSVDPPPRPTSCARDTVNDFFQQR